MKLSAATSPKTERRCCGVVVPCPPKPCAKDEPIRTFPKLSIYRAGAVVEAVEISSTDNILALLSRRPVRLSFNCAIAPVLSFMPTVSSALNFPASSCAISVIFGSKFKLSTDFFIICCTLSSIFILAMRSTTNASISSTANDLLRREISTFIFPVLVASDSRAIPTVESPPSARIA